jgi:hypothetical protein
MPALKQIEVEVASVKDLALIGADDSIWLVVPLRWWDLATLLWWLFIPADKKRCGAHVMLRIGDARTLPTCCECRAEMGLKGGTRV